jgi:Pyrroline-5-carboxylate reductase
MNIGFIGTGHITSSVIEGISKSNLKVKKIYISPRNQLIAKRLSKKFKKVSISKHNQQLIDMSDWIFLAVTPNVGENILRHLYFKKNKKIISFISTINLNILKQYTSSTNIIRVLPLPFIGMKKGPIIISPPDRDTKNFFNKLGKVIQIKNEKVSKNFWTISSFMAPFYEFLSVTSEWLVSKGVKRNDAEDYVRELFLALSEDAVKKKNISLKQLVRESQTPGGINAQALNELKKKKFYKIHQKVLNSVFKRF